jgi:putative iron-dependent peroxidase
MAHAAQAGILEPGPRVGRYLFFSLARSPNDVGAALKRLAPLVDGLAVQQWVHDFGAFEALPAAAQDAMVVRRRSDNEELEDAPASAHIKRLAQERFTPEAFVVRRSMPWTAGAQAGLGL